MKGTVEVLCLTGSSVRYMTVLLGIKIVFVVDGSVEVGVDTCEAALVVGSLLSEAILWLIRVATDLHRALSC